MLIVGLDFETTGLDPRQDRIIELGAVLWDVEDAAPLKLLSCMVKPDREIPSEITALTGITNQTVAAYGIDERAAFAQLYQLAGPAMYFMAHNGTAFDKLFFDAAQLRIGEDLRMGWLDSRTDIKYPDTITTRNLRHLASEHNFLNPFPHRAVFDVLTMLTIASRYPIEDIIARAAEPTVYVAACVSFDEKEKAKARGYYWHGQSKTWWRAFKASDYEQERETCGFRTIVMPHAPEERVA